MAAVPPAVANAHADALLDDVYQGGHANLATQAGRASKRRKYAEELSAVGAVTDGELGEQQAFAQQQVTAALPPGAPIAGVPAWFGPALAAGMAPLLNQMQQMQNQMQQMQNQMQNQMQQVQLTLNNVQARQRNSQAMHAADPIHPIGNAAGNPPPNFPADVQALNNLNQGQRGNLLQFYGLPVNPVATRESRLRHYLGLPR